VESQSLGPQLLEVLQTRYAIGPMTRIVALEGGEWKNLFRLDGGSGILCGEHQPSDPIEGECGL